MSPPSARASPVQATVDWHAAVLQRPRERLFFAAAQLLAHAEHERALVRDEDRVEHEDTVAVVRHGLVVVQHFDVPGAKSVGERVVSTTRRFDIDRARVVPGGGVGGGHRLAGPPHHHAAKTTHHALRAESFSHRSPFRSCLAIRGERGRASGQRRSRPNGASSSLDMEKRMVLSGSTTWDTCSCPAALISVAVCVAVRPRRS